MERAVGHQEVGTTDERPPCVSIINGMLGNQAQPADILLESLLEDADFEELELLAQPFNIFEVLGAVHQEIRHSNFLAWLLNPSQNHGLGDHFIRRFLWEATRKARDYGIATVTPLDVDALDLSSMVPRREWRNIDLTLVNHRQRFICAIENKLFSGEHGDQLSRYARTCSEEFPNYRSLLIFLSATGVAPSSGDWVSVGYDTVRHLIDESLLARGSSLGPEIQSVLRQYSDMIGRYVMQESEVAELCERVYSKHQQALDLLFLHRPDKQGRVAEIVEELIRWDPDRELEDSTKEYIHFAPRSWEPEGSRKGSGWTKSGRILLFEFVNRESLRLQLYIGPGDQQLRGRVFQMACANSTFKPTQKTLGAKWNRVWHTDFLTRQEYEQDIEWIETRIKEQMNTFDRAQFPAIDQAIRAVLAS